MGCLFSHKKSDSKEHSKRGTYIIHAASFRIGLMDDFFQFANNLSKIHLNWKKKT